MQASHVARRAPHRGDRGAIQTVCDRCGTTADRAPFSELSWSVALNARVCLNCYSRHAPRHVDSNTAELIDLETARARREQAK